jgi:Type VI secretion system/phage-baseplate injector OB domain
MQKGRILANVPDVSAILPSNWAMPCIPFANTQMGIFVLPPVGSKVWIEFEQGNPAKPIWTGCFWGDYQMPLLPPRDGMATPVTTNVVVQNGLNTLVIHGTPGPANGIVLSIGPAASPTSPKIEMTPLGITLSAGTCKIEVTPMGVKINGTGVVVLPSV